MLPEKLRRALLLQALYTIRSEGQLLDQLDYTLLFRWFVGLGMADPVWSPTTCTKNRDRLLEEDVAAVCVAAQFEELVFGFLVAGVDPCTERRTGPVVSGDHGRSLHGAAG